MKIALKIIKTIGIVLALFIALIVGVFFLIMQGCHEEVIKVNSPNNQFTATVDEFNGGAMTSYGYTIYVSETGKRKATKVAYLYGAFRREHEYGVNVKWVSNEILSIEYLKAKSVEQNANVLDRKSVV